MARSITFLLAVLGFVAAAGRATPARGDLVDFDFSGTITASGPANLLPDVNVGDPFSGSGSFTTYPGSGIAMPGGTVSFTGPGTLRFFAFLAEASVTDDRRGLSLVAPTPDAPPVDAHKAVPPTFSAYDTLVVFNLTLSPDQAGFFMQLHHSAPFSSTELSISGRVDSYSIRAVPEPGGLVSLGIGGAGVFGLACLRRGRRGCVSCGRQSPSSMVSRWKADG